MSQRQMLRCLTINTHRGRGPKLPYLLAQSPMDEAERIELLHETRAYTYYIAEWLHQHRDQYDVVGLQEVFNGVMGFGDKLFKKFRQRDHFRLIGGFRSTISHGVGFAGFRYENLMMSQMQVLAHKQINFLLPGRIMFLAASGFTLAPFVFNGKVVWVGNTHLHPYNPSDRARQARSIAHEIRKLEGEPVIFMGDLNTVPPGCRVNGFEAGARDDFSYKNDKTLDILTDVGLRIVEHNDSDQFYTYPTGLPNRTLDYILYSKHWQVEDYQVLKEFKFSDHYPVFGEFSLKS